MTEGRIFDLGYGHSASGKTHFWCDLAEDIYVRKGQKTRLYIGDGGLATVEARGLIGDVVDVCVFNDRDYPLSVIKQISQGWWVGDDPNGKLVAPGPGELEKVGLFVYEGLTVIADYIMGSTKGALADRAANGEKIGQDSPISVTDPTGFRFGGNPMAHYGFAQRRIVDFVQQAKRLPGHVFITAHEKAAEDDGEKIIGPNCGGKALTSQVPLWFGNTLHFATATKRVRQKDKTTGRDAEVFEVERRLYTRPHGDPDGTVFVRYLANTRIALDDKGKNPMPEFLAPPDPVTYYKIINEAREAARARREAKRA